MATTIITKHSETAKDPQPSQLERGELAVDLARKNIYTKDASDEVVQLGGRPVKIGSTAPPTPQEGDLWMEVPTAVDEPAMMWVYDGDKWLEHPSGVDGAPGLDGADGADGNIADGATDGSQDGVIATWDSTANGGAGQWTPTDAVIVDGGNVGIGGAPANTNAKLWMHGPICLGDDGGNWSGFIKTKIDKGDTNFVIANAGGATTNHIVFETNAGEALRINGATGNVGIGTTSFSGTGLSIAGGVNGTTGDGAGVFLSSGTSNPDPNIRGTWIKAINTGGANNAHALSFATNEGSSAPVERLRIDSTGDATFSGTVSVGDCNIQQAGFNLEFGRDDASYITCADPNGFLIFRTGGNVERMRLDTNGNLTVTGTINGVRNVIGTRDLIETLSTLRTATQDETIDVRQALASACDKLIEKFESMQEVATQEISND